MKLYKYYTLSLIVSLFFVMASCTDTFSLSDQYLKDGETIYTNKVDTLQTLPGKNRIKITGYISNAFNVNEIIVFWDKGKSSQRFPYTKSTNDVDKVELVIDNLEERSYEFEVYSSNSNGNKSIKMTTFGTVYGETYRSNLEARAIDKCNIRTDNSATINFKPAEDLTRTTQIKFTNLSGVEMIKTLANTATGAVLDELDATKPILYRTFYVPTKSDDNGMETTIDEFDSDWKTYNFPSFLKPIALSTNVTPVLGGILIDWKNTSNQNINVTIGYVNGTSKSVVVKSNSSVGSTIVSDLLYESQEVTVLISDAYGNSFGPKSFTTSPLVATKLSKTSWSIIGFDSEEPAEANWGPPIQGSAAAAIDGDLGTFWHSAWDATQPDYPHYFIVDMKSVKQIASFGVYERQWSDDGASQHEFWVSEDNVNWTKVGSYSGVLGYASEVNIAAAAGTKGRYVKYVAASGPNFYAHLAEFSVYGAE